MTTRFFAFLLVLLGLTLPAAAQTPDPPRFLLESVVVEGVQRDAVREIVAAESLLQPGREYSEQELREAVYRIKRLPFVLDAEFSLRKGGERGSYQLLITVEETRLLFFSADVGGLYDADDEFAVPGEDRIDWFGGATVGGRWFLGSQGLLFGSVSGVETVGPSRAQAGYTRYNLFGRGGFTTLTIAADISDENDGDSYQGNLSMGLPIVGNHSIRADLDWSRFENEANDFFVHDETRRLGLSWIYDSTDDPLFPTAGTRVSGGVGYSDFERELEFQDFRTTDDVAAYDLGLVGRRHWALTTRQSVAVQGSSSWNKTDFSGATSESWSGAVAFAHSTDLWGFEKTERFGDFRWENTLEIFSTGAESDFSRSSSTNGGLSTALVFRNAWGVTRLSFAYVDNLDRDFRQEFP